MTLDSVRDVEILAILRNRGWGLVDPEADPTQWQAFTAQVRAYLQESDDGALPRSARLDRAVIGAYCPFLCAACQSKDRNHQSRAYEELWRWIYPRVARKVSGGQNAEDVAQEVFVIIHKKVQQVDRPRGFLAWVNRIIKLQIRSHYQQLERRPPGLPFAEADEFAETAENELGQVEFFLDQDEREAEAEIIALLDDCFSHKARQQRLVFVERVLHERSVLELTRMLDTTPGAIHILYHRARDHIRRKCPKVIDAILTHSRPSQRVAATGDAT